jgi:pimeloyl-ACP methyl ester carboxylesterase
MTSIFRAGAAALAIVCAAGFAAAQDLPRRGTLGLALAPAEGGGMNVVSVVNPAADDFKQGDTILAINGVAVSSAYQITNMLGSPAKAGTEMTARIRRDGSEKDLIFQLVEALPAKLDERPLELGQVEITGGARIRTLLARPVSGALTKDGKAPAVMIVPGIPCQSGEVFANAGHPDTRLYKSLVGAGFAVFVVEKPGVGDSEGGPCLTGGFDIEIEAFREAAKKLGTIEGIDPARLFAIGISMGGYQAPLFAKDAGLKGIVTWGTVVMPWADYVQASFRRRTLLQGESMAMMDPIYRAWRKVAAAVFVDGKSRAEIQAAMPDVLAQVEAWSGNIDEFGSRSVLFAQEADKANVGAAWQAYEGELLALHGEYDWVAEDYDHALAAHILNLKNPGSASFEVLPGLDHGLTRHKTMADSFARPFQGEPDDQFLTRVTQWLTEQAKG